MIILKSREEIAKMRASNRIIAEIMALLEEQIKPGITTLELDRFAESEIRKRGATPAFKGYLGFQHTLCVAPNEVVVHGIPNTVPLKEGDILGIDCGVLYNGFYGDHARTFTVGQVSEKAKRIIQVGEEALAAGIEAAQVGNRLFDISASIQAVAEKAGYSIVRDFVGHGVGTKLHEDPQVPNFGVAGTGLKLRAGLVLALEPMINEGTADVEVLKDGWTVVTRDRKLSVHVEHSVAITENGPEILSIL